ncbi:MAG: ABC transporter permease [Hyphomicrobium sp.]
MRTVDEDGMIVTVYTPNERRGGLIWGARQAYGDLVESRYVIARLFWRDFIAQFRQKILGYFWAILNPLFGIASFLFLFAAGVLHPGEGEIPYTLYVLVGSTIWACLPAAMTAVAGGLQAQADLIMRTRVPKLALAVSSLAGVVYSTLISMVTMMVIFLVAGYTPSLWFLAYPILILPMVLLGTGVGLALSVLGTIARDVVPIVTQVLAILMYLTPVIYVRATVQSPMIATVIDYNPLTYLIEIPRSLVCLGHADNVGAYLLVSLGTFVLIMVGLRVFYLLEDLVAERL